MKLDVAKLDAKDRERIGPRVLGLLLGSRWRKPERWPDAVICHEPGDVSIVSRLELAHRLRASGLDEAAHEVIARKVGPGSVLLYVVLDREDVACAGFVVLDLLGGQKS